MRISDWSSDVCSSDLPLSDDPYETETNWWSFNIPERKLGCWIHAPYYPNRNAVTWRIFAWDDEGYDQARMAYYRKVEEEIGSASCRERVCQYGVVLGGCRFIKKKKKTKKKINN